MLTYPGVTVKNESLGRGPGGSLKMKDIYYIDIYIYYMISYRVHVWYRTIEIKRRYIYLYHN